MKQGCQQILEAWGEALSLADLMLAPQLDMFSLGAGIGHAGPSISQI